MPWVRVDDGAAGQLGARIAREAAAAAAVFPPTSDRRQRTAVAPLERCGSCGSPIRPTGECRCSD